MLENSLSPNEVLQNRLKVADFNVRLQVNSNLSSSRINFSGKKNLEYLGMVQKQQAMN